MYSYDDLFLFAKVAEIGSFINTAKILKISHTTVSRRITNLESQLKTTLINRNTKMFELTEVGVGIYNVVKLNADNIDDLITDIVKAQKEPYGTLNVVLPNVISLDLISPHIPEFLEKYPKINLNIWYQNKEINLLKDGIDVALINHIPKQQTQKIKNVCNSFAILYCTKEYAQKYGIPKTPEELKNHLTTGYTLDTYEIYNNLPLTNFDTGEVTIVNMPKKISTNSSLHNLKMIYTHQVIGALLSFMKLSEDLVPVLPNYFLLELKFYLIKHPSLHDLKIQVFSDFIENILKQHRVPLKGIKI